MAHIAMCTALPASQASLLGSADSHVRQPLETSRIPEMNASRPPADPDLKQFLA